ncbi:hypothetical protein TRFO_15290 [Tritrichomonas foetus]|uniref:Viral A-type inclusion protein n=1 Tax=Tritrichomonas foetus TaxID=1144522 RepID=A0A1J4KSV2_9EUKA|nr:hypothetical protein TRFO_15290 [Tritrichomonas foetus]|eukprot:OHT14369.1 hypothetical protein TRFO_15290 [Tritrichomonas foetus]
MADSIEKTDDFEKLSRLVDQCMNSDGEIEGITFDLKTKIKLLVNNMISLLNETDEFSELFNVLSRALYILFQSDQDSQTAYPNDMLPEKYDFTNINLQIVNQIAETVNLKNVKDLDGLIDKILKKKNNFKQLKALILSKLNLPDDTKIDDLVPKINEYFDKEEPSKDNKNKDSMNEDQLDEIYKTMENLKERYEVSKAQAKMFKTECKQKDELIRKMKDENKNLKGILKEIERENDQKNAEKDLERLTLNENDRYNNSLILVKFEEIKRELVSAQLENNDINRKIMKKEKKIQKLIDLCEQLRIENEELMAENQILKQKMSDSFELNTDIFNQSLSQNLSISSDLNHPQSNNADLESQINNLNNLVKEKDEQFRKCQKMLSELAKQYEIQNDELNHETECKFTLFDLIQRLLESNMLLESELKMSNNNKVEIQKQFDILKIQKNQLSQQLQNYQAINDENLNNDGETINDGIQNQVKGKFYCHKIMKGIQKIVEDNFSPVELNTVNKILDSQFDSDADKILATMKYIVKCFTETPEMKNLTDQLNSEKTFSNRLYSLILSQLKFINELSESRSVQKWLFDNDDFEWNRSMLQSQAVRMENYLSQSINNKLFTQTENTMNKKSNFFNELLPNEDETVPFSTRVSEYLAVYQDEGSNQAKDLYIMLIQCLTANEILQDFSTEARLICNEQLIEIQNLKESNYHQNKVNNSSDSLNYVNNNGNLPVDTKVANESGFLDITKMKERVAECEAVVENVKNILRKAILDGKDFTDLEKCIEMAEKVVLDQSSYQRELEMRLGKQKEDSDRNLSMTTEQIIMIRDEMKEMQEECQKKIDEDEKIIIALKEELEKRNNEVNQLRKSPTMDNSDNENSQNFNENQSIDFQIASQIEEKLRDEFDAVKAKYEKIVNSLRHDVSSLEKAIQERSQEFKNQIHNMKEKSKIKQAKLIKVINILRKQNNEIENQKSQMINEKSSIIEKINAERESDQKQIEILNNENNSLKDQISNSEAETKLLQWKIKSIEEKIQREKSLNESQMKMKMFSIESDYKNKIEQVNIQTRTSRQELLTYVCDLFKDMVDINQPLNEETVYSLLNKVKTKLTRLSHSSFVADSAMQELEEIKSILSHQNYEFQGSLKASSAVKQLCDHFSILNNKIKELEKESCLMKNDFQNIQKIQEKALQSHEWTEWSKRMMNSKCANQGFEIVNTPAKIRSKLEEVIFSSVNNKQLLRGLEILRSEKCLLLRATARNELTNFFVPSRKQRNIVPRLRHLIIISTFSKRLEKMSGHNQSRLSLYRNEIERNSNQPANQLNQKGNPNENNIYINSNPNNNQEDFHSITFLNQSSLKSPNAIKYRFENGTKGHISKKKQPLFSQFIMSPSNA